jgi:hypothetical protein
VENLENAFADVRAQIDRIRVVVQDVQALSRDRDGQELVDVRECIQLSIHMAMAAVRHRARVVRRFGNVPLVKADGARLGCRADAAAQVYERLRSGAYFEVARAAGGGSEVSEV